VTPFLRKFKERLPQSCITHRCKRDRCSLSLQGAPTPRLIVDLDAKSLGITNRTRCDYLFVSDRSGNVCVAPIEFKQGSLSATHVQAQLTQGSSLANDWLPHTARFEFVPILAHRGLRSAERNRLRKVSIAFRGRHAQPILARCDDEIRLHLPASAF